MIAGFISVLVTFLGVNLLIGGLIGLGIASVLFGYARAIFSAFSFPEIFILAFLGISCLVTISRGDVFPALIEAVERTKKEEGIIFIEDINKKQGLLKDFSQDGQIQGQRHLSDEDYNSALEYLDLVQEKMSRI
jgi:hypothetical protein